MSEKILQNEIDEDRIRKAYLELDRSTVLNERLSSIVNVLFYLCFSIMALSMIINGKGFIVGAIIFIRIFFGDILEAIGGLFAMLNGFTSFLASGLRESYFKNKLSDKKHSIIITLFLSSITVGIMSIAYFYIPKFLSDVFNIKELATLYFYYGFILSIMYQVLLAVNIDVAENEKNARRFLEQTSHIYDQAMAVLVVMIFYVGSVLSMMTLIFISSEYQLMVTLITLVLILVLSMLILISHSIALRNMVYGYHLTGIYNDNEE